MRHLNPSSPFNKWVLPVRGIGLAIGLFGFVRIVDAIDAFGIIVAVLGSLVWQAGTLLEERSQGFRALDSTSARDAMITTRIDVAAWRKVGQLRDQLSELSTERAFFVTIQEGYESGIVLPEQLRSVSDDRGRYLPIGQWAHPISYVDSIRDDDSLLTAFENMEHGRRDYALVLNRREQIVGVVTRSAITATLSKQIAAVDSISIKSPSSTRAKAA